MRGYLMGNVKYRYTREDSVRDARKIKRLINKGLGNKFHVEIVITRTDVQIKPLYEFMYGIYKQVVGEDTIILIIGTYSFLSSNHQPLSIKVISDLLYKEVNHTRSIIIKGLN